jgi:probable rRNA maturation factor
MNHVEFINTQRKVRADFELKSTLERCVGETAKTEGLTVPIDVDITFVSDRRMRSINREHRGINKTTDVLSFPMADFEMGMPVLDMEASMVEGRLFLGDIIISLERAQAQAEEYGHSFLREAGFLCVHSMLHLLGYDHEDNDEGRLIMRKKEEAVLAAAGLAR